MKVQTLTALLAIAASSNAHNIDKRHAELAHKRQTTSSPTVSATATSAASASAASAASTVATGASSAATGSAASVSSVSGSAITSGAATVPAGTATYGTSYPALSSISLGMPSEITVSVTSTYTPGASPTYYSGAEPLPTAFVFSAANWPAQDKLPDTSSSEVQEWMKELDGWDIPDISQTADGTCVGDPAAAANASARGWWTCGGTTRDTDITDCPSKPMTWGVSFDDGPAFYTTKLLSYLSEKNILATFFVVGSRVIERPAVLIEEYMTGHEISVHTWSHPHLTTLTNAQIVAELGWTRKAIKEVLGVTPTTMRPPYGDIDDRVRAISLAMGMVPIIWTRTPSGISFDTFDWEIPGGVVSAPQSFSQFEGILGNASTLDNGFVVLQHDLYPQTVDMAIGYTLPAALSHQPAFDLQPIGQCNAIPYENLYVESNTNASFPIIKSDDGGIDTNGDGTTDTKSKASSSSSSSNSKNAALPRFSSTSLFSTFSVVALAALAASAL